MQKRYRTANGRFLSGEEIIQYEDSLKRKAELDAAQKEVQQNLKTLNSYRFTGSCADAFGQAALNARVTRNEFGEPHIIQNDADIKLPSIYTNNIDPDLLKGLISILFSTVNVILVETGGARKAAMEPLTSKIEEFGRLAQVDQETSSSEQVIVEESIA